MTGGEVAGGGRVVRLPGSVSAVVAGLAAAEEPVCAYVYDRSVLRGAARRLRAVLPAGAQVLYAMKANGHPAVVAELARELDGVEVASGGELAVAVAAGARQVVFGGPGKTDGQLVAAVAAGALVNVESVSELRRLDVVARAAGRRVSVAVRVNRPGGGLSGSHAMAGVATQFGVDEAQLGEVVAAAAGLSGVRLVGFSLHAVSNNLDAVAHARFVVAAVAWAVAAGRRLGVAVEYVNVGGGFGVDYVGGGRFDLAAFGAGLAGLVLPAGLRLVFEPGRWLAADAGWYAAQVVDVKCTQGRWFAVVRGGTHHFRLPAAWGYDHPFAVVPVRRWPYPFARAQVAGAAVDVAGELCTPRDVLCRGQVVGRLRIGDVVVFDRAGAYGWDISHHDFLRHPYPRVVVV
ncbi:MULTISPECIES: alanine racemase [unclassified Solwaraspora]|uniref:alanine racemase n=1 Tax=unclassified Solwaraspora TaxID=2627926 RepID=UPI00259B0363|nr:alanine racemase [Solwaraspora sp. WMMA2056]WJK38903.1 alanine racemase [Solwaraspora sp. WMMA2056]